MASVLDIINGISQAAANAYDGSHDERYTADGEARKVGLKREEGDPILDSRVMDGFNVRFYGNMMCLTYMSEVQLKKVHQNGFEDDVVSKALDFDAPDGSVRINTSEESNSPTTRLKLIKKDDESYYVKTPSQSTVFLIQYLLGDFLLMKKSDILVTD